MNINSDKPWLRNYPEGVSSSINFDEYSSLVDMFEKTCNRFSLNKAFTNFGVSFTFKEIYQKSSNLASFLQNDLNLSKGSRVSIMMPNILQYPISTFGILKAGLIVENINPLFTVRELETQLINSKSETIIILENFAHLIEKIIHKTVVKNIIITSAGELLGIKGFLINFVIIIKIIKQFRTSIDKSNLQVW